MFPFEHYQELSKKRAEQEELAQKENENFLEQIISKENQIKCVFHSHEDIEFFCLNLQCKKNLVCTECLLEGTHEGHEVENVLKLENSWNDMLKNFEIKIKYQKENFRLQQKKTETHFNSVFKGIDHRKMEISQAFEAIFEKMKEKRNEIFDFFEKQKNENEEFTKKKQERIIELIKICDEGLEKITFSENLKSLSILDLSNNFSFIRETYRKLGEEQESHLNLKDNYNNTFDAWLSRLASINKIVSQSLCLEDKQINHLKADKISKINFNSARNNYSPENDGFDFYAKDTVSFACDNHSIKESFLAANKPNDNKSNEISYVKRKIQNKFGQLLEVFKPGLARSKLSGYHNETSKQNLNSFYKTPEKKSNLHFEENNSDKNSGNKYVYSLEKQKLKYVGSAKKLI